MMYGPTLEVTPAEFEQLNHASMIADAESQLSRIREILGPLRMIRALASLPRAIVVRVVDAPEIVGDEAERIGLAPLHREFQRRGETFRRQIIAELEAW